MTRACDKLERKQLEAWVDGEVGTAQDHQAIAAHISACPRCAAYVAELRRHKDRLAQFGAATTPAALPIDFWDNVHAGLDRVDAARGKRALPARIPLWRRRLAGLVVAALLAVVAVLAFALAALRPRPSVPFTKLRAAAVAVPRANSAAALMTNDADRAARWLGDRLGTDLPTANLALSGAQTVGAEADPTAHGGAFFYRTVHGEPVALHIFLSARADFAYLRPIHYYGATYHLLDRAGAGNTLLAWEVEDRCYVAVAPMSTSSLLPLVHEMNRQCRQP